MIGAIAGDIIGSIFEADPIKTKEFPLFSHNSTYTDDSVLTIAVAEIQLQGKEYAPVFRKYFIAHPNRGYGYGFQKWASTENAEPYNSYGNGSAMRVSPIAWSRNTLTSVLSEAKKSAEVSHNHKEGIKGAQAIAAAIFLARNKHSKDEIRDYISNEFGYALNRTLESIRPSYSFDVSCQGSVPEAIIAFLESSSYEDAVRNAVSLGGDSDTMACMAGAIAEAYFGEIPKQIIAEVNERLPTSLDKIVKSFRQQFLNVD